MGVGIGCIAQQRGEFFKLDEAVVREHGTVISRGQAAIVPKRRRPTVGEACRDPRGSCRCGGFAALGAVAASRSYKDSLKLQLFDEATILLGVRANSVKSRELAKTSASAL